MCKLFGTDQQFYNKRNISIESAIPTDKNTLLRLTWSPPDLRHMSEPEAIKSSEQFAFQSGVFP